MEMDWLREMMRLSGVPEEDAIEEDTLPFIPGMLPQTDEAEKEAERRFRFRLAEQQTRDLIEEQEALRDSEDIEDE